MHLSGYHIDIMVTGFPGKSVCHGSLGWSTIVLVHHGERLAIIDVGAFGQRKLILEGLAARGLTTNDVTDVLLTHCHYDHALNWVMFPDARIVIGEEELAWGLGVPWGSTPVPELYVRELDTWPTLHRAVDGESVFPGLTAHLAPGHTPGHLYYVLEADEHDVIFTGDAAKNRAELLSRRADMTFDADVSRASIETIWKRWRGRPGNVVVPGHDVPMKLDEAGTPNYLGDREAAVRAWYGEDLDQTTVISLTIDA